MADEGRTTADNLEQWSRENPYALDFFQAVRRLESLHPEKPRVGHSRLPQEDYIRFGQQISLAFAASTISDIKKDKSGAAYHLTVAFLGLLGPNGPFPLHITEYVRDRVRHHADNTLASFLDIFNHRMISLFYRAWASTHPCVSLDRVEQDRFGMYIASLFGLGEQSSQNRDAVADAARRYYSGRLVCQTKNAEGLTAILRDFFGIPVEIKEFIGQWVSLPAEYCCRIGQSVKTGSLGAAVIVGSRVWDCQQKFRLRLGPMNFSDYERLLPGGQSLKRLKAWVDHYTANELGWDVQLILKASEVPDIVLGVQGRLGFSTWTKCGSFRHDSEDLILCVA